MDYDPDVWDAIIDNGCDKCGNNDPNKFDEVETDTWDARGWKEMSGTVIHAVCMECGAPFSYSDEPDWDSERGGWDDV